MMMPNRKRPRDPCVDLRFFGALAAYLRRSNLPPVLAKRTPSSGPGAGGAREGPTSYPLGDPDGVLSIEFASTIKNMILGYQTLAASGQAAQVVVELAEPDRDRPG